MSDDNIGARVRTAVGWRALAQFANQGITVVASIVLARLLAPDDFGIIGMAAIVIGIAQVFRDLGFGQALVQREELRDEHKRSAFWITLMMAGLLYAAMYLVAPYAGDYFEDQRMAPVLRIMALSVLIAPFGVVPRALLQRELDFKRIFLADMAIAVTYGGLGITGAVLGYGYWSLVWGQLASYVAGVITICVVVGYAPPLIPSLRGARDLLSFGVGATGISLADYSSRVLDRVAVGRRLDTASLGIYDQAYRLAGYLMMIVTGTLSSVLFSGYARLQHDLPRLCRVLARSLTVVCLALFPLLALLVVSSPELVPTLLGPQWAGAARPTQLLAGVAAVLAIVTIGTAAMKARGHVFAVTAINGARGLLILAAAWFGATGGIDGVAVCVLAAFVVTLAPWLLIVRGALGFGLLDHARALRAPVLVAMAGSLGAVFGRWLGLSSGASALGVLALTGVCWAGPVILTIRLLPFEEVSRAIKDYVDLIPASARGQRVANEDGR